MQFERSCWRALQPPALVSFFAEAQEAMGMQFAVPDATAETDRTARATGAAKRICIPAPHHRDMLGHHFAQHAAERLGLAQFGKSLFRVPRRQCPPDRHALLDIALIAQSDDGIAFDRADFHQAFEEPVNDSGAVQERGRRSANA